MPRLLVLVSALLAMSSPAWSVEAECGLKDLMLKFLHDKYGELPAFTGDMGDGISIVVTISPTGTWTVVKHKAGWSCIVTSGGKWLPVPHSAAPPPPLQSLPVPAVLPNGLLRI
jgi:hypothetical protein